MYLAAIIFNRLIIRNKYSAGNIDAQLFWGYTLTNGAFSKEGKEIRRFHNWLGDTLNMLPTKRKRTIKDAKLAFEKCCDIEVSKINSNLQVDDYLETNVGKGKKEFMENAGREESEWNEDSIEKWEKEICNCLYNYLRLIRRKNLHTVLFSEQSLKLLKCRSCKSMQKCSGKQL